MELNHILICWVVWVHLTTHPAVYNFSCQSLKTLLSLQTTAASQLSGDWEAMHGSWGKSTMEYISRQKLNWKLLPSLLCVVVLVVETTVLHLLVAGVPLSSQLSVLDIGNLGFGLEFPLAGIQGDIHVDNLTCSLNLRVLRKHLSHTPHTHSQGFCIISAWCHCLISLKKLFLCFLTSGKGTRLGDKPV